jgi:ABC-type nickel/cobalt efflux system permease component RcnA
MMTIQNVADSSGTSMAIMTMVTIAALALIVLVPLWVIVRKGRAVATGTRDKPAAVFRASRLSRGNRVFPTQVAITPHSVIHYTPQWIGRHEHSIHISHVASVSIDTGLMFSDVIIETTGGTGSIRCRGHHKGDAVRMKELIEAYQSSYYRAGASDPAPARR